jgi:hypothetical protein
MASRHDSALRGILLLLALAVAFALAVAGCARNPAPRGWLSTAYEAESTAYGGWLRLSLRPAPGAERPVDLEGEFLSVGPDSLVRILTAAGVHAVPLTGIERARLTGYDVGQTVGSWTFPGVLFTWSNGYGLILTAPLWLLTGTVSTHGAWNVAKSSVPGRSWNELRVYARFPAGWPPGLDPERVRPDARWPRIASRREEADSLGR